MDNFLPDVKWTSADPAALGFDRKAVDGDVVAFLLWVGTQSLRARRLQWPLEHRKLSKARVAEENQTLTLILIQVSQVKDHCAVNVREAACVKWRKIFRHPELEERMVTLQKMFESQSLLQVEFRWVLVILGLHQFLALSFQVFFHLWEKIKN